MNRMMLRFIGVGLCLLAWLALGMRPPLPTHAVPAYATPQPSVRPVTATDTLRYALLAGETFITALPDSIAGVAVQGYRLPAPPALSWLIGHSFFWRTTPKDVGTHVLDFQAQTATADTLLLPIELLIEAP